MIALNGLVPEVRRRAEWCVRAAEYFGIPVTVTSVKRDWAKQQSLYDNFLRCKARGLYPSSASISPGMTCKYPANPPGQSAHEYGLAWDSWVEPQYQGVWRQIREYAGFRVPSHDLIHAELPQWREIPASVLLQLR